MLELLLNILTSVNLTVLFLAVFLNKEKNSSNNLILLMIINQFLFSFNNILILTGWIHAIPYFLFISYIASQLNGPIIYKYVDVIMDRKSKGPDPLYFIIILPVILTVYYWMQFILKEPIDQNLFLNKLTGKDYPFETHVMNGLLLFSQFVYLLSAIGKVIFYSRPGGERPGPVKNITVMSSLNNNIFILICNTIIIICYLLLPLPLVIYLFIPISINLMYLYFIYTVFRYSIVFSNKKREPSFQLDKEILDMKTNAIVHYLNEFKPFKDPGLTIAKLANQLKIPKHHLSYIINNKFNKNYFELINSFRVEEAKKLLCGMDRKMEAVDSIGYDVGFYTKSAFYRSFKKYTNQTPAQFLKKGIQNS
jgi:AraC-like DNA-binding protein